MGIIKYIQKSWNRHVILLLYLQSNKIFLCCIPIHFVFYLNILKRYCVVYFWGFSIDVYNFYDTHNITNTSTPKMPKKYNDDHNSPLNILMTTVCYTIISGFSPTCVVPTPISQDGQFCSFYELGTTVSIYNINIDIIKILIYYRKTDLNTKHFA